ncbi:hypothetical protein ABZ816_17975 [Actinosynnema sp. NPDC047251]|nr:hypothetical protein [Saccharothrix espanaensis]
MSRLGVGLLLVTVLAAAGCGRQADTASDGGGDLSVAPPVARTTAPVSTSVPPEGPCQVRFEVAEMAEIPTPAPATTTSRALPGDMPPNHVDNRSWRVRKPLRPDVHAETVAAAEKVKPGLGALCDEGTFSPEATRAVFVDAGRPTVWLTAINAPYGTPPPPGVVFVLTLESPQGTGCVLGQLQPGQLLVSVAGTTGEGSCYEPPSH